MTFLFFIPIPTSTNHLYVAGKKRRFKDQKYCDWITLATLHVNQQKREFYNEGLPLEKGYRFNLYVPKWDNRVRDITNYIKAAEDLMVRCGVVLDDRLLEGGGSDWIPSTRWDRLIAEEKFPEYIKAIISIRKQIDINKEMDYIEAIAKTRRQSVRFRAE